MHVHRSDDEMFYILDGTVTFEIDGERFTATSGSMVFAPHGLPHSYITEEETRWLMFIHEPSFEQLWHPLVALPNHGRFQMIRR